MSHFMVSMPSVGLDGQSAAVEGDPLADEGEPAGCRSPAPSYSSTTSRGGRSLPWPTASRAAHLLLLEPVLVEDAAVEAEVLSEFFDPLGEGFRIQCRRPGG